MDFGDGLTSMELPNLKNRRAAALAKRAGFGAVRRINLLRTILSWTFKLILISDVFQVMMPELDGGGFGEFASLVKRKANPRADVSITKGTFKQISTFPAFYQRRRKYQRRSSTVS